MNGRFGDYSARATPALALIGMFLVIAAFLYLYGELVRGDQIAARTARETAELEAAWRELQVRVLIAHSFERKSDLVHRFSNRTLAVMEDSHLSGLSRITPSAFGRVEELRRLMRTLTPEMVETAARSAPEADPVLTRLRPLRAWLDAFSNDHGRSMRILLILHGAVLLAGVAAAITFLHSFRSTQLRGHENRLLAQRLIRTREDERSRIAAELHDRVAQTLGGASMIASVLAADHRDEPRFARLHTAVDESLSTVRNLARDLGVSALRGIPLDRALDELMHEQAATLDMQLSYQGLRSAALTEDQKLHIYRIVQECLANTLRHAGATKVRLRVSFTCPDLVLRYGDNGVGFNTAKMDPNRPQLGLRGMKERARMLDGELSIKSTPGSGTEVTLIAPLGQSC
ncbi:MAG: sensor histidine kinase [Spirochaetaceae bacterium]